MPKTAQHRLDNGLTVLVVEAHEAPVVALQAWVAVGAADELPPVLGVAHLHEHMLFKGTARRPVGAVAREVEAAGGEINAWTSFDETVYHLVMARDELGTGIDILADVLAHSRFDPDELAREIEVVLEEIRRSDDSPGRRASNALFARAYAGHPYSRPVLGSRASVAAMTREQILAFYRQYYRPDNITLVAAGDVTVAEVLAAAEAHLGQWRPAATPLGRPPRQPPKRPTRCEVTVLAEDVVEARVHIAWPGPSMADADLAAADALSVVLGGDDSSRLMESLRRRHTVVNDVHASAYTPREPGLVLVGASMAPERLLAAVEGVAAEARRLVDAPVTEAELDKARTLLGADSAAGNETVQGRARKAGTFAALTGDPDYEQRWHAALAALTPADLHRCAAVRLAAPPTIIAQVPTAAADTLTPDAIAARYVAAMAPRPPRKRQPPGTPDRAGVIVRTLGCGATLLYRQEDSPRVALRAVARGGQRWEAQEQVGCAQLLAHIWGQRTESVGAAALAGEVAGLGGSLGAFAGRNSCGLTADFLSRHGAAGLKLFAEVLTRPALGEPELSRERDTLLEAIASRVDSPATVAYDLLAAALFPAHPYGVPLLGTAEALRALDEADLWALWRRHLAPHLLTLAVVGPIELARVEDALDAALGTAAGPPLGPPSAWSPPAVAPPRRRTLARQQAQVVVGALGTTLGAADRFALDVATTVLGGQGGRLFTTLRDQQSLAYSVSAGAIEGLDPGQISVHMGVAPTKVDQALAGVHGHLDRLLAEPIDAAELARAQRYLVGAHAIGLQRAGTRATTMALDGCYGLGHDSYLDYPAAVRAVDAAAVQAVARRYLAPEQRVEVVVGPTG